MLSKQLRKTPAEVYFIAEEFTAWSFNRAVTTFGMAVENDIHINTKKAKTTEEAERKAARTLEKWLREPTEKKFKDPAVRG